VFLLAAGGFVIPCLRSNWHGNVELHTLLEAVSTVLELGASAIALTRYYTKKTPTYLFLGGGLGGAALLDTYHAVITSSVLAGLTPSAVTALTAWSGVTPRVFLSLLMLLSSLAPKAQAESRLIRRIGERGVYALVGGSTLLSFLVFTWIPLPELFPHEFLHRPANFVPALFFGLAALVQFRKRDWNTGGFEHWLILSLIAAASGHLFYLLFSSQLYDAPFFAEHVLKLLSLLLLGVGLVTSVSSVFRSEAEAARQLRYVNAALAEEIGERVRAEQELRNSRGELELRVQERTADLAERDGRLQAAYSEIELFLTSIPSILVGLDCQSRIILWNPSASETFGIAAHDAMGRTLQDCGIRLLGPDINAEVSRWLLTETLHQCDDLAYERDGNVRSLGLSVRPIRSSQNEASGLLIIGADVTERKKSEAARAQLAAIVQSCDAAIIGVDPAGRILSWNAAAERIYGYSPEEAKGRPVSMLWPPERSHQLSHLLRRLSQGESIESVESMRVRKDGELVPVLITYSPVRDDSGRIVSTCSISVDITERKLLERQLAQAQKLESIGQLAAGVAHEINTPIQYVGDNLRFLRDSFVRVEQLLEGYDRLLASVRSRTPEASLVADVEALAKATRVSYLRAEIPKSIQDSLDGAGRVAEIVRAIKEFSHAGPLEKTPLDINRAIESTILVSRNEWKNVAELNTDMDPDLPPVLCMPGEFNQAILNLIVNAAHAIAEAVAKNSGAKGEITVSTRRDGDWVEIRVRDTGTGIPEEVQPSIFNPFFTTKAVGKGTGQGLAIAHAAIVQKHGGTISFETAMGVGTTFQIRLPIGGTTPETSEEPCANRSRQ